MQMQASEATARALVAAGKGILAADESAPNIEKRFKTIQVESNEKNRRDYRAALARTEKLDTVVSVREPMRSVKKQMVPL